MTDPKVVVKKVNAFPFAVQFKNDASAFTGSIVKMSKLGFLAEVTVSNLQPNAKLECSFVIPVFQKAVNESVTVIKIYHRYVMAPAAGEKPTAGAEAPPTLPAEKVLHLVEFHFRAFSPTGQQAVLAFLAELDRKQK